MQSEMTEEIESETDIIVTETNFLMEVANILDIEDALIKISSKPKKNFGDCEQLIDMNLALIGSVKKLKDEKAEYFEKLNKKQNEIDELQEKLQGQITLAEVHEETANDYSKQTKTSRENEKSHHANFNDENVCLKRAKTDLQNNDTNSHTKYELLTENKDLINYGLSSTKSYCEETTNIYSAKLESSDEIAGLVLNDLALSSDDEESLIESDNYLHNKKVSVMTNTKPWICLRCLDLEMEISYLNAIRTCTKLPPLLSPIADEFPKTFCSVLIQTETEDNPKAKAMDCKLDKENEEFPKTFCSVLIQTEAEYNLTAKALDCKPDMENESNMIYNNTQEISSIDGCPRSIINSFAILSELKRNRDKLLHSINARGCKTINNFNKLDLNLPHALPEVMKLMYNFLHDVIDSVQDTFEVITKQFNKTNVISYFPEIGKQITSVTLNDQADLNVTKSKSKKKRSYKETLAPDNTKESSEFSPSLSKRKISFHIYAKEATETSDQNRNDAQSSLKACEGKNNKMDIKNKSSSNLEALDGYLNNKKIKLSDGTKQVCSSSEACATATDADVLRMKRNLEIFAKAKLSKKCKKKNIKVNAIPNIDIYVQNFSSKTKVSKNSKTTKPKLGKMCTKNDLFGSESEDENSTKEVQCIKEKGNENSIHDKIICTTQQSSVETSLNSANLENHFEELDNTNKKSDFSSSDLISISTPKNNVACTSTKDEQISSQELVNNSHANENVINAETVTPEELEISFKSNLISPSESFNKNCEVERNELKIIDDAIVNNESIEQNVTGFGFYEENSQKMNTIDFIDTLAKENYLNSTISAEVMTDNTNDLNFYEERNSPDIDTEQKVYKSEVIDPDTSTSSGNQLITNETEKSGLELQDPNSVTSVRFNKSSELLQSKNETSTIINNANSYLQSALIEQMIDHQIIDDNYSYESSDKPIYVLSGLLKQYVFVNRWKNLTAQFSSKPQANGKKFEMKIKQVKEILVPFLKQTDMIPSLPDTIGKLQDLNLPNLSVIILECLLYNMSNEWYEISKQNKNPTGKLVGLLYHLSQIYNGFLDYTINAISYKIFRLKQDKDKDDFTQLYAQIYIGFCMKCQKYSSINTFLVDSFYCLHYKCINVVQQLLVACPNLLQVYQPNIKENLLHTTIKYLIWEFKSSGEKLATSPNLTRIRQTIFFQYKIPEDSKTLDGLLAKILTKARTSPDIQVYLSTILLARRESPAWVLNKLINQGFLTLLQDSWNEYVDSTMSKESTNTSRDCGEHTNLTPKLQTVKLCVDILGAVGRPLDEANKDKVISIIFLMKTMLASKVLDSIPELQETIISALIQLSRHQFDAVADAIMLWEPKFLPSARLVNKLKRFMHRKHYRFWTNKLYNQYNLIT